MLLAYPYLITQLCLVAGVQELSNIDKMIEATNTSDLGLIRDATNPMDIKVRQGADIIAEMFRHSCQTETAETIEAVETGGQTATTSTTEGTSSAPPLV